ncbi:hypothetical protein CVT25_007218 [Psilocybe cyanescens]|uniref:Uncharacterized protein n=1 Tax=Psilocybe cyanescens TaxID=93625 RepID=A0A409X746_PSICY|nr:hypothetical protein CVT25_007218 [Psilocybe cyanescens]
MALEWPWRKSGLRRQAARGAHNPGRPAIRDFGKSLGGFWTNPPTAVRRQISLLSTSSASSWTFGRPSSSVFVPYPPISLVRIQEGKLNLPGLIGRRPRD